MKTIRLFLPLLFAFISILEVQAQNEPLIQQYIYNMQMVNPAYAGNREALTIAGIGRFQWVGIDGAPTTQALTVNTPLNKQRFGIGLTLFSDQIAKTTTFNSQLDLSVRFPVGKEGVFSFGMKGSIWRLSEKLRELELQNRGDDIFKNPIPRRTLPNVGAGAYYRWKNGYAGVSVPHLLETSLDANTVGGGLRAAAYRHYYGVAGWTTLVAERIRFKASSLLRYTTRTPFHVGLNGRLIFHEKIMMGLAYNYRSSVGLLFGLNLNEQLRLGYNYDWAFSGASTGIFNTSHEIALRYDFLYKNSKGAQSPRFF